MNYKKEQLLPLIHSDERESAIRYTSIAPAAAEECKKLREGFRDRADWVSGWAHAFVCPECAGHMTFDIDRDMREGELFTCSVCKKQSSGTSLDQAWVYYYRITYAKKLEAAAVCALLGDTDALDFMTRYFDFYAENYEGFAPHLPYQTSKLMPQVLDEAVWCTYALRALYPCRKLFSEEKLSFWHQKLFRPIAELVCEISINRGLHNHILWHMAAGGMVCLTFGDEELRWTIDGEYGIRWQTEHGFTEEGFWFEGSQLYHYYAAEALTGFCQLLADQNPNDPLLSRLDRIYIVPMLTSHDGWSIPSMNDGWYPLTLERFAGQLHRAAWCTGSRDLMAQLDEVKCRQPELLDTPQALLLERAPSVTAAIPGVKLAVIRKPLFAILKSGVVSDSHRQDDCLSVVMPPISNDLGTPGYAHKLYKSWYCTPASHNTITINGIQPMKVIPTHVETTEKSIRAVIDGGWDGVVASRTLTCEGGILRDVTEVQLESDGVVDWIFHMEGVRVIEAEICEAADVGEGSGYRYFADVRRLGGDHLTIRCENDGETLTLDTSLADTEAFIMKSPGNPSGQLRDTVILRKKGCAAVFDVKFRK